MEKPKTDGFTPESYEALRKYAQHLTEKLRLEEPHMNGTELGRLKANVKFAWKEAHDMAISVSQNFASRAREALNEVIIII